MARQSKFKSSSYDRIADILVKTPEWSGVRDAFVEALNSLEVRGSKFQNSTRYDSSINDSVVMVTAYFQVQRALKDDFCIPAESIQDTAAMSGYFNAGSYVPEDAIRNVVSKQFGTPACPTFNCTRDKVFEKLKERAKSELLCNEAQLVQDTLQRLWQQAVALSQTEEFKVNQGRTFDVQVIKEFKKVLLKYGKKVSPAVLKEAFDEYITHEIMET